jgi:hypothetical protein
MSRVGLQRHRRGGEIKIKTGIFSASISGSIYDGYSQCNLFNIIFQAEKFNGPTVLKVTGDYKKAS